MRASTVFALALSLLIGLAAAAGAKYAGLFDKKPIVAAVAVPPPVVSVLAARNNLYAGYTITSNDVMLKQLSLSQQQAMEKKYGADWKSKLMPALTSAAHLRTPERNIMADEILFGKDFAPATLPDELTKQLEPNTRAVNVKVTKEHAAGGAIRVGEYVDVLLTASIGYDDKQETRTATIARGVRVIMKRNNIWGTMAVDADNQPLNFTLEANAYRAALIEYAKTFGQLSLMPVPAPTRQVGTFTDLSSPEYSTEDRRIEDIRRGDRLIGQEDLARIFKIPPSTPKYKYPPIYVQHLTGVNQAGTTVINRPTPVAEDLNAPPANSQSPVVPAGGLGSENGMSSNSYGANQPISNATFKLPNATGEKSSGCKSCDEKRKRELEAAKPPTILRSGN